MTAAGRAPAKPDEQAAASRRRRRQILGAIGVVGLVLLSIAISRSLGDLRKGRAHETDLNRRIADSSARIEELEARTEALENDPEAIETLAREELLMARPNEVVVLLPEEVDDASAETPEGEGEDL